jgi:hypothetical protein
MLGEAPIGSPPKSPVGRLNWSGLSATAPRWGRFPYDCTLKISRVSGSSSLPTFCERNNASSHHDNNDDGGKRLHRGQGLVPAIPKLEHALVSSEIAPSRKSIEGRACATENAMLRFVARVLIARQHDLCGTGDLCAVFLDCVLPHRRHTAPQRPRRGPPAGAGSL